MTLTELRYIVAVARERHFGRAADACFVSQPTLSVSVKKLEGELGTQIFERGGSEVSLTPIGDRLVIQAQRVLDEVAMLGQLAAQGRDPLLGPLKVGVIYTIGPYLLPRIIKQLIRKHPEMPLILSENYTIKLLEQLRTGEIDVAILAEPFDAAGLDILPLYDEEFLIAVPKGHGWEARGSVPPNDLKAETMLLLGVGHCFRDQVLEVCPEAARLSQSSAGIQKTFEGSSLETIRHMVASGLGITVLPKMAVLSAPTDPLLTMLSFADPIPTRRVSLIWRKSFARLPAVECLRDIVLSVDLPGCTKLAKPSKPSKKTKSGGAT
ncbi:MAG: LysR substrate-binding domain-containing protein [Burkholderiaceae bacterium]|jgi:LysR family transcriptional regulator, hydrogen peroxide-inducible genes activator|nr:LysR substrate-binding domain-containing protein [Burkholderiaceae bacterium]MDP4800642.1 LysR substrate-binding domain-containing protein [Burkholderiaceae bacterium]